MVKVVDLVQEDETVGDFIWRMSRDEILTEELFDEIAEWVGTLVAAVIPLPIPGKRKMVIWVIDKNLPQLPLKIVRKLLLIAKLIKLPIMDDGEPARLEVLYPIPELDQPNPFKQ